MNRNRFEDTKVKKDYYYWEDFQRRKTGSKCKKMYSRLLRRKIKYNTHKIIMEYFIQGE